mgnify:CR=1 FL=1|tara:strand:- start:302 stop:526 length:225 start_codon:yes stop_codon:yes gene_type:complete
MTCYTTTMYLSRDEMVDMLCENDEQFLYVIAQSVDRMDLMHLLDGDFDYLGAIDDPRDVADKLVSIASAVGGAE